MRRQAYGVWKPPLHMPFTIIGAPKKKSSFLFVFPLARYFFFYFSTMLPLIKCFLARVCFESCQKKFQLGFSLTFHQGN
jgi:hypothetical protein